MEHHSSCNVVVGCTTRLLLVQNLERQRKDPTFSDSLMWKPAVLIALLGVQRDKETTES
jgi:hypothetical protein